MVSVAAGVMVGVGVPVACSVGVGTGVSPLVGVGEGAEVEVGGGVAVVDGVAVGWLLGVAGGVKVHVGVPVAGGGGSDAPPGVGVPVTQSSALLLSASSGWRASDWPSFTSGQGGSNALASEP